MTNTQNLGLDWDSTITEDGNSFVLLEPGEYDFTVEKFERARSQSGNNMAKLTLKVTDGNKKTNIIDNIVLTQNMEWKLSSFFGSLGLKKKGEPLKMNWESTRMKSGRCTVKVEEYTKRDGTTGQTNRIDSYIYAEDVVRPEPKQASFGEEKVGFTGGFNFTPPTGD